MKKHPYLTKTRTRAAVANLALIYGQLKEGARNRVQRAHDSLQEFLAAVFTDAADEGDEDLAEVEGANIVTHTKPAKKG